MRFQRVLPLSFAALLGLGAYRTLGASDSADAVLREGRSLQAVAAAHPPAEAGTFPETWIHGADCAADPAIQVHAYNENLFILRQSKCATHEAPFLFLIFGSERALLMDTGATPTSPVWETVSRLVDGWLERNHRERIDLVVAHTHSHGDHLQGDSQFVGKPLVSDVVPHDLPGVFHFWGFQDYPEDQTTIDLGERVLDVLGTPGHHPNSVTLYDRRTQLLLTGDIVYPGHLFVFDPADWTVFKASIRRLIAFAAEHPVTWVLGCHVEMTDQPGRSFKYSTPFQPGEHSLQLSPDVLPAIWRAADAMGEQVECAIFDEFVLHPVFKCNFLWNG